MDLWFRTTDHAVGQGLMCSGELSDDGGNSLLTYVYDCGSSESGNAGILKREVRASVGMRESVDVLYISHFDEDHVNGVKFLARERKIGTIVIPSTSLAERILRFGGTHGVSASSVSSIDAAIVRDPQVGLAEVSPDSEIVVVGETPPLGRWDDQAEVDEGELTISPVDRNGAAQVWTPGAPVWMLKPWTVPEVASAKNLFLHELGFKDEDTLEKNVQMLLQSDAGRSAVRKAYKSALKKVRKSNVLNFTSLCLYSGPAVSPRATYRARRVPNGVFTPTGWQVREERAERSDVGAWGVRPGWIGTGDALLKEKRRSSRFESEYSQVAEFVGSITLPHHGSKRNFSPRVMLDSPKSMVAVASSGTKNNYGHPSPEVLAAVSSSGGHFVSVNESEHSRFTQVRHLKF